MSLDFSHKGKCIVTMHDYVDGIIKAWDEAVVRHEQGFKPVTRQKYDSAAPVNLFTVNEDCEKLPEGMAADYHTISAKTLYVTKRARPDTCLSVAFLTTRVRAPDRLNIRRETVRGPLCWVLRMTVYFCGMWMHLLQCIQTCGDTLVEV